MRSPALLLLACAACGAALAQQAPPDSTLQDARQRQRDQAEQPRRPRGDPSVTWNAPRPLRDLFEKHLPVPKVEKAAEREAGFLRPWIRDVRRRVPEIAASEGYFSATVDVEFDEERERATITVVPGPRTVVDKVDIEFRGDIAREEGPRAEQRERIRRAWALAPGAPFRSPDWDVAKTRLQEELTDQDYPMGVIATSEAIVDAEAAKASLHVVLDSGLAFKLGAVEIEGLGVYSEALVRRIVDLRVGERYSRTRLQELQKAIQNGPWFASVVVDVEQDPARAEAAPVRVTVTERPTRDVGLAVGYGTDDGARIETAFRHRNLLGRGFDLQSSIRAGQERQIGFVDVYMPPGLFGTRRRGAVPFRDSVGVLAEHSTIEKLKISRLAAAGYRHFRLETWEARVGLSWQVERSYPEGSDPRFKRALAPIGAVTWRFVDDLFDPKRGGVLNVQAAAGSKALGSGNDFLKVYGQYQHWIPVGARDQILLRTEFGTTIANSREGIPEDFLFRAGGSRSNRGYAYQSLGPREGNAVVGGRYMVTGTAEFVHWLNAQWGGAVFADVGDASDTSRDWQGNPSYGVGARYKTPAGPFALDLAYAERARRFRLSFSVTVAF